MTQKSKKLACCIVVFMMNLSILFHRDGFDYCIDTYFLIPLVFSLHNMFSSYKYQQKDLVG